MIGATSAVTGIFASVKVLIVFSRAAGDAVLGSSRLFNSLSKVVTLIATEIKLSKL